MILCACNILIVFSACKTLVSKNMSAAGEVESKFNFTSFKVPFFTTSATILKIQQFCLQIRVVCILIRLQLIFWVILSNLKYCSFFAWQKQYKVCTQYHTLINNHQKWAKNTANSKCEKQFNDNSSTTDWFLICILPSLSVTLTLSPRHATQSAITSCIQLYETSDTWYTTVLVVDHYNWKIVQRNIIILVWTVIVCLYQVDETANPFAIVISIGTSSRLNANYYTTPVMDRTWSFFISW